MKIPYTRLGKIVTRTAEYILSHPNFLSRRYIGKPYNKVTGTDTKRPANAIAISSIAGIIANGLKIRAATICFFESSAMLITF